MLFSISDGVKTSPPKYRLMEHDEQIESSKQPARWWKWMHAVVYTALFICLVILVQATWKCNYSARIYSTEIFAATARVTEKIKFTLNQLRDFAAILSAQNRRAAFKYLEGIEDILDNLTAYWTRQMNEIFSNTNNKIETELYGYDTLIQKVYRNLTDPVRANLTSQQKSIASASQPSNLVELLRQTNNTMEALLAAVDDAYAFSVTSLIDIVKSEAQKTVDCIGKTFLRCRNNTYQYVAAEQIDFCSNISEQNYKTEKLLQTLAQTVDTIDRTAKTVDASKTTFKNEPDSQFLTDASAELQKAQIDGRRLLQSMLKDESYFLGSFLRAMAMRRLHQVNDRTISRYHTAINNFAMTLQRTTAGFRVVAENNTLQADIETALDNLHEAFRPLLDKNSSIEKNLKELKHRVQKRLENMTRVYNDVFDTAKRELIDDLRVKTESIVLRSKIYTSSLSIRSYLPSSVCPLAVDFQSSKIFEVIGKEKQQTPAIDVQTPSLFIDFMSGDSNDEYTIQTEEIELFVFYKVEEDGDWSKGVRGNPKFQDSEKGESGPVNRADHLVKERVKPEREDDHGTKHQKTEDDGEFAKRDERSGQMNKEYKEYSFDSAGYEDRKSNKIDRERQSRNEENNNVNKTSRRDRFTEKLKLPTHKSEKSGDDFPRKSNRESSNDKPAESAGKLDERKSESQNGYLEPLFQAMKPAEEFVTKAGDWAENAMVWMATTIGEQWEREWGIQDSSTEQANATNSSSGQKNKKEAKTLKINSTIHQVQAN